MGKSIVCTDKWHLSSTNEQLEHLRQTQKKYRQYVRALIASESPCASVERLMHKETDEDGEPKGTVEWLQKLFLVTEPSRWL